MPKITIKNGAFQPDPATMDAGFDSVFWLNADDNTSHQPNPLIGPQWYTKPIEGRLTSNDTGLPVPGAYPYKCTLHPHETGTIISVQTIQIQPAPSSLGSATIPSGGYITWANRDTQARQLVFPAIPQLKVNLAASEPGGPPPLSSPIVFDTAGAFSYQFADNPAVKGIITVAQRITISAEPLGQGTASFEAVTIAKGQSVIWVNNTAAGHQPAPDTPDASGATWPADPVNPGTASAAVVFSTEGEFVYHCNLHPGESGKIVVTNA